MSSNLSSMANPSSRRINAILAMLDKPSCYLEIGVETGQTFFQVSAEYKTAVDPRFRFDLAELPPSDTSEFYEITSDQFFSGIGLGKRYDLIFLDGLHSWDQTYRDFCNALLVTHDNSIIIIDDIFPCDVFSCNRNQDEAVMMRGFMTGEPSNAWHGDTYKMFPLIQAFHSTLRYCTIVTDGNPQAIVWRTSAGEDVDAQPFFSDVSLLNVPALDYIWFLKHQQMYNPLSEQDALAMVARALKR
jgi:hypothetical protein